MSKVLKLPKARRGSTRWWIGVWATIWWAVSLLYVGALVWFAKDAYVQDAGTGNFVVDFWNALTVVYPDSGFPTLLYSILAVWVIGGLVWLRELKRQGISFALAFKDLLLTIRR